MNIIKVYKNGNKTKSMYLQDESGYSAVSNMEIHEILNREKDKDFKFISVNEDKKDITYRGLLNILVMAEKSAIHEIDLNNVIRSGGFVNYIKKLEGQYNESI